MHLHGYLKALKRLSIFLGRNLSSSNLRLRSAQHRLLLDAVMQHKEAVLTSQREALESARRLLDKSFKVRVVFEDLFCRCDVMRGGDLS